MNRSMLHSVGLALCIGYVALLVHTAGAIGLSRDEGIYVDAAQQYAGWLELLARDHHAALAPAAIDAAFRINHEHPPLMKLLFGLGFIAHQKLGLFASDSLSFRFAGMLSAGLLLWLIYVFGAQLYGRSAGLFAALAYALLPRPFYHAHLNAFDAPITLASTAVTYAYWRSLREPRFAIVCGLLFGLALLTKHNSWILPFIFVLHFGACALLELGARKRNGRRSLNLTPWWLIAMLSLGPLLFVGGWPWLWHDTLARLRSYAAFHLHHEYYNIEYFGVNYFWPPFPASYAWVMTLFTVPLTTLAVGLGGMFAQLDSLRRGVAQRWSRVRSGSQLMAAVFDPSLPSLLLFAAMLAPLAIISIPTTPIFGGTKHWFPAYPMLALFAGRGFQLAIHALAPRVPGRPKALLAWTIGLWLLVPAAIETAHSHPFGLSHYTVAAGGVP
ncbi:MAG TPA: glycosyltransferase family 39 protein, partial [Polyangiales bacterium]